MQVKDKIKVYEYGKKSTQALTPAQYNKLLLQERGGGIEKKKIQKPIEEEDDEIAEYENQTEDSQSQSEVREPKTIKKIDRRRTVKSSNQPQINYTNPQLDLEELIRLRTENTFIKQQHQDAIKQVEKYKQKIKDYKQPKKQVEEREVIREEEPQPQPPAPQMRDSEMLNSYEWGIVESVAKRSSIIRRQVKQAHGGIDMQQTPSGNWPLLEQQAQLFNWYEGWIDQMLDKAEKELVSPQKQTKHHKKPKQKNANQPPTQSVSPALFPSIVAPYRPTTPIESLPNQSPQSQISPLIPPLTYPSDNMAGENQILKELADLKEKFEKNEEEKQKIMEQNQKLKEKELNEKDKQLELEISIEKEKERLNKKQEDKEAQENLSLIIDKEIEKEIQLEELKALEEERKRQSEREKMFEDERLRQQEIEQERQQQRD
ncbi:MAG: hypothetical protein EZS28_025635 [Streblomastix strix]|uniref:Uncharacterized protein n=1 Tax=Streblomastix strix TaxID=222440 RepID=A0A5J4V8L3_9EUKA|nr:MAG: hypothetical protein EZS28_025635 [Streblomastix strix]